MKRSFSLAESASKAKEQRNIWSSENQVTDIREEENVNESTLKKDLNDDEVRINTLPPSNAGHINVDSETVKPRVAKPVNKTNTITALKPKSVLRPKSTSSSIPQATFDSAAERPSVETVFKSNRPQLAQKPLERKSPPFGERYTRITTYLEKPLLRRVHDLHQRGEFAKIASLINAAVSEYLDRYFPS